MGVYTMVVAIVLIAMVSKVLQARYRAMGRIGATPHVESAEAMQAREEIRQLRERVQVLERVITDNHGRVELDRQIEQLRDH